MNRVIKEEFSSIHHMLQTINSRSNNQIMRNEHSSQTADYDFTRTRSYDEAIDLISKGYTEILPKVKSGIKKLEKKLNTEFHNIKKIRPDIKIEGFTPHVPNSILNLPNSMINIDRHPQKQKTLDIIYVMGACCGQDAQLFIDAGIVLLTAIKILELNRISVRLRVSFKFSSDYRDPDSRAEILFPTVLVKDYGQRIDLQKLCFPIAHPSMFRRFGFKWLETHPDVTGAWSCGYGYSCAEQRMTDLWDYSVKQLNLSPNQKILKAQDIEKMKFEIKPLLDKLLNKNA